jgi:hypothetical protein
MVLVLQMRLCGFSAASLRLSQCEYVVDCHVNCGSQFAAEVRIALAAYLKFVDCCSCFLNYCHSIRWLGI